MPSRRLWITLAAALALTALAAFAYTAFRSSPAASGSGPVAAGAAQPKGGPPGAGGFPVPVEVATVEQRALAQSSSAVGSLRSNESVVLRPEAAGRIVGLPFREGQPVAKGAVLVELDGAIQKAELMQAEANLALAQSNARRQEELFGKSFVAERARDEAAANLKAAEAAVALAQARLARTVIRAPFAGTVGIRSVSVGDYVKDGQDLVNLEDIDRLKVDFRLPEADAPRLTVGQAVKLDSDTVPGKAFNARVTAIDPQVDAAGRSIRVRAELANSGRLLRPGMFVRVSLEFGPREGVLLVPEEALVPSGSDQFVFRVVPGEPAKVARVGVDTGVRRDGRVEIRKGLAAGDQVVVAGQLKIRDGAAVKPMLPGAGAVAGGGGQGPAGTAPLAAPQAKG
jgi:membrane fusion protein (multidrug efflux system)